MEIRLVALILCAICVSDSSSSSVPIKWPQYIFQPRFQSALDNLQELIKGSNNELSKLFEHVDKISLLTKAIEEKAEIAASIASPLVQEVPLEENPLLDCVQEASVLSPLTETCLLLVVEPRLVFSEALQKCRQLGGTLAVPPLSSDGFTDLLKSLGNGTLQTLNGDLPIILGIKSSVMAETTILNNVVNDALSAIDLNTVIEALNIINEDDTTILTDGGSLALLPPIGSAPESLLFKYIDLNTAGGYLCEIPFIRKTPNEVLQNPPLPSLLDEGAPNQVDVEQYDQLLFSCSEPEQFVVGDTCYRHFEDCVRTTQQGVELCTEDGGILAMPDLSPDSNFVSILAGVLDNVDPETPILIDGSDIPAGSPLFATEDEMLSQSLNFIECPQQRSRFKRGTSNPEVKPFVFGLPPVSADTSTDVFRIVLLNYTQVLNDDAIADGVTVLCQYVVEY